MAEPLIREVWASNLEEEFLLISKLINKYTYVGMDTEFPGFIIPSPQSFGTNESSKMQKYHIQSINVNLTRIIQIGITLGNAYGQLSSPCTWQFNFKINLAEDLHANDSVSLLKDAGIDFEKFERDGIDVLDFAALLYSSGLVMNEKVTWINFHGGYDFSYLLKMLTGSPLPSTEEEFFSKLKIYFPNFYDVKYIMLMTTDRRGEGLQELANALGVERIGTQHQAGSDSYVTLLAFYRYMNEYYHGILNHEKFKNVLFGLNGRN